MDPLAADIFSLGNSRGCGRFMGDEDDCLGSSTRPLTTLLNHVNRGAGGDDPSGAFARLVDAVYDDLRRVAAKRMRRDFNAPLGALTESPTSIAHQALLRLREQHTQWKDADHFFAIAARLLGYVICDYKKHRMALKRGAGLRGHARRESLDDLPAAEHPSASDDGLEAIEVIQALHDVHPRKAEVVTLHVLAGRSMPDVAKMIGVSLPTAERDWKFAKAWIRKHIRASEVRP